MFNNCLFRSFYCDDASQALSFLHLGESSSVSKDVRSMLASFRSLRLRWSAAGGTAGGSSGSSSSSCVGCRDPSIVSSVIQLKVKEEDRSVEHNLDAQKFDDEFVRPHTASYLETLLAQDSLDG